MTPTAGTEALSFPLSLEQAHPVIEHLSPWSEGFVPRLLAEARRLPSGHPWCRRHAALWSLTLTQIRQRTDPAAYARWEAHIPDSLLATLQKEELDDVATLYLLRQAPVLLDHVSSPMLIRCIRARWCGYVSGAEMALADDFLHRLCNRPLRDLFFIGAAEGAARQYGRHLLNFLRLLRSYTFPPVNEWSLRDLAPFLPAFFNSKASLGYRLRLLRAFMSVNGSRDVRRPDDLLPLFKRCLRQQERVGVDELDRLVSRLCEIRSDCEKKPVAGLLRAAPSIAWLKKILHRAERRVFRRFNSGLAWEGASGQPEFPAGHRGQWPGLVQIRDSTWLNVEGLYMGNCIATYKCDLHDGDMAAYAMAWPERCTVLIEKEGAGWRVEDARTWEDERPSADTMEWLENWLTTALPTDGQEPPAGKALGQVLYSKIPRPSRYAPHGQEHEEDMPGLYDHEQEFCFDLLADEAESTPDVLLPERIGSWFRKENESGEDFIYTCPACPCLQAHIPRKKSKIALVFHRNQRDREFSGSSNGTNFHELFLMQRLRDDLRAMTGDIW